VSVAPIDDPREGLDVAIVGMAGRFPGARDLEAFWANLRDGVESIREFSDEELEARGVPRSALRDPSFVKAGAVLDDPELFDAAFFGFSPREARLLDPQHRLFLECSWQALERAGYDSERYPGIIGVYAGTSLSSYLLFNLLTTPELAGADDSFPLMVANDKDFLCTRASYALNLDGPSIDVQSGCSTSLVAVHLACQGLLAYQTDMALAGGVSVQVPQRTGYYYQPGGITSPDGHCRAFDARAEGTIFGSGIGVVVLKRLADALADGDHVHAVIRGSAVNNDGSRKVGYTAPGLDGQLRAIEMAQAVAGVEPQSVTYVETHGTATALGDPVEVSALTRAFRTQTERRGFCALGAVKTNIGHLDAAAGVAGLIKTVLALEHGQIPPSLHFAEPNPRIDFEDSPFYVNRELADWPRGAEPRRAGVSSFGIGGTNAHVVLEEAPAPEPPGESRQWQLLLLSAKTEPALDAATIALADFLRRRPEVDLADAAYTLQVGRRVMAHRRLYLCASREDAVETLEARGPRRVTTHYQENVERPVAFLFPGGGAQYVDMARGLYDTEPVFRDQVDAHAALLRAEHGLDLFDVLYPADERREAAEEAMQRTSTGLPALFVVEHALARLWASWGIRPQAMIGHSLGEYVAACLAGVLTPETALELVVLRGKLFEELPEGGMISVPLSEDEVRPVLGDRLSLAAINGPAQCVVSGTTEAIEELSGRLAETEVEFRPLKIDVAAHSHAVDRIRDRFREAVATIELRPPSIPFLSNVTGTWITAEDAVDPDYWGRQLRETVRFGDGVGELLRDPRRILLEVGPGQGLSTLVRAHPGCSAQTRVVSSVRHPYERQPDAAYLLDALGRLWLAGAAVDWPGYHGEQRRRRVVLPTYPFERQRYWIDPPAGGAASVAGRSALEKRPDVDEWFYLPSWRRTVPAAPVVSRESSAEPDCWLVLRGEGELGRRLATRASREGRTVVEVVAGERFGEVGDGAFGVRPGSRGDLRRLLEALRARSLRPRVIVHLWSLPEGGEAPGGSAGFEAAQQRGFYGLLAVAQAFGEDAAAEPVQLWVVSDRLQEVESGDRSRPEHATMLGACKVVPQEYPRIVCRAVDVAVPAAGEGEVDALAAQLMAEIGGGGSDRVLAYRGGERWVQGYEPVRLGERAPVRELRERGVYLITGGLGGVGLTLAGHLARTVSARLVLVGRSHFPAADEWDDHLAQNGEADPVARTIERLRAVEAAGGELLIARADVSDEAQMRALLERVDARFGRLDGVVHAAGVAGEKALRFIPETDRAVGELQFASKAAGLYALDRVLAGRELDFCLLCSSNASILGGLGSAAYAAANAFMDAFALARRRQGGAAWISANWDGWLAPGEERLSASFSTSIDRYAMAPEESVEAFERIVTRAPAGQVVVSTGDLAGRLDLWVRGEGLSWGEEAGPGGAQAATEPRRGVDTPYVPPSNELESIIAKVWQEALGVDRLGIHDNFFDLGGNSLIGLRVVSRLRRELAREIQVVSLFEGPTVSALAALLGTEANEAPAYEESRGRGEARRRRRGTRREASVSDE
jgi:acyl transferase domain-containing protein